MKIAHLIRKDFITVNPYLGVNTIKKKLLQESAIVVEDESKFYGILTTNDLIENPKTLVIDCLTNKTLIDFKDSIEETLNVMNFSKTGVLPVGKNGKFIGLVFKNELYNYISEYNLELENIIKERTAELENSIASRDVMFSIIAHDLKSPFNVILGFTNLLKSKLRNLDIEKSEKIICGMNSHAKRTYNLLEDLLSWAKNKTGRINYNPIIFNVPLICKQVIEQMENVAQSKGIKINNSHNTISFAFADKNMIEIVLRNLISNALKFTPANGEIEIYSIVNEQFIEVAISDNGIGISDEEKEQLFSLNLNTTKFGTQNETGTGLGLILCKDFIERNQGEIWVEEKSQKGATFKFTLPIYKEVQGSAHKINNQNQFESAN